MNWHFSLLCTCSPQGAVHESSFGKFGNNLQIIFWPNCLQLSKSCLKFQFSVRGKWSSCGNEEINATYCKDWCRFLFSQIVALFSFYFFLQFFYLSVCLFYKELFCFVFIFSGFFLQFLSFPKGCQFVSFPKSCFFSYSIFPRVFCFSLPKHQELFCFPHRRSFLARWNVFCSLR